MSNNSKRNQKLKDINYIIKLLGRKRYPIITEMTSTEISNKSNWKPYNPPIKDTYTSLTTVSQDEFHKVLSDEYSQIENMKFYKDIHVDYLNVALNSKYPSGFKSLDANHTWMIYWLVNSLVLLKSEITKDTKVLVRDKIESCIIDDGIHGISGGRNQIGHVASAYAAILSLILIEEYELLNRIKDNLYNWFMSLKTDYGFRMHEHGESDTRSIYCVLIISTLLNIKTEELMSGVIENLKCCQTFEGGFGNVENCEAHGGYTYCGIASFLILLKSKNAVKHSINFDSLLYWSVSRQGNYEGGFNGRTNKLVDSCYSFWIGGTIPILESIEENKLFQNDGLKNYILTCCQNDINGGFIDKPGRKVDFYHTNYALSGLSIIENEYVLNENESDDCLAFGFDVSDGLNELDIGCIHPVFAIPIEKVNECKEFFYGND
ncbi:unnamed protein product [Candida verbasci]|uniref:Protein farnesyltransferase subunit beta n=1 Tax=Candida verbasci TaxID=1227364 RepID=A0A9W4U141_9ASCO|nr:unnamed protein product [Candida verbasci]